jgi:hypothetical protein
MRKIEDFYNEMCKDRYLGIGNLDRPRLEIEGYRIRAVTLHGDPQFCGYYWQRQTRVSIPFWGQTVKETNAALKKLCIFLDKKFPDLKDNDQFVIDFENYAIENNIGQWYKTYDNIWYFSVGFIDLTPWYSN